MDTASKSSSNEVLIDLSDFNGNTLVNKTEQTNILSSNEIKEQKIISDKLLNGDISVFNLIKNPTNEMIMFYLDKLCELKDYTQIANIFKNIDCNPVIYKIYVNKNYNFIKYVPDEKITQELCDIVFANPKFSYYYINLIPHKFISHDNYKKILTKDVNYITSIPKERITKELCDIIYESVKKNYKDVRSFYPYFLTNIPHEFHTNEMYEFIIKVHGYFIRYVPTEKLTQKMCDIAFDSMIGNYNIEFQYNKERRYVFSYKNILLLMPEEFQTTIMYKKLLDLDYTLIENMDVSKFDNDMYSHLVNNEKLCHYSLKHDGHLLKDCPFKTFDNCKIAYQQNKDSYKYIPIQHKLFL